MGINCVCIIHDDDVVLWSLQQRVVVSRGAPVGAVPRCFSAKQQLFCRGDREASRGEFEYSCHRHGWRAAGLYRPGEKSVGRRDDDEKKALRLWEANHLPKRWPNWAPVGTISSTPRASCKPRESGATRPCLWSTTTSRRLCCTNSCTTGSRTWVSTSRTCTCTCPTAAATAISSPSSGRSN